MATFRQPIEFDYDLFKDSEGKFFIRIRGTGVTTEVSVEVFRLLRNEAMKMYREQQGVPVYKTTNGKITVIAHTKILSLSQDESEDGIGINWLVDTVDLEKEIIYQNSIQEFRKLLTDKQLDVFENCLLGGMTNVEYAKRNDISESAVRKTISLIKKKYKLF